MTSDALRLETTLRAGLKTLNQDDHSSINQYLQYILLLHKWNRAYNLTAIRDVNLMVSLHLLDSLAILPWVNGSRVLDVGTGAGLPGVPLAIANPSWHVVLLDSNGKKIRFLNEVKRALSLDNIEPIQTRVENYRSPHLFDTITSRAFSSVDAFLKQTRHLKAPNGICLAMKGRYPENELTTITPTPIVQSYAVAGIEGERCCVIMK